MNRDFNHLKTGNATYPLTSAQKRVWVSQQIRPESTHFNLPVVYELEGNLDCSRLNSAFSAIFRRHEALRAGFLADAKGQPFQNFSNEIIIPIEELRPPANSVNPRGWALKHILSETAKPFNLATPPLIKCLLFQLKDTHSILAIIMHHIIVDAWSLELMMKELSQLYNSGVLSVDSVESSPGHFARYVLTEQTFELEERFQENTRFWSEVIGNNSQPAQLPTDRNKPIFYSPRSQFLREIIPDELSAKVSAFAKSHHTTPFTIYLSAFYLTLNRLTQQKDLTIGCISAGRNMEDSENLVGFFVNVLPFRTRIDETKTMAQFFTETQDTVFDFLSHQDFNHDSLLKLIQPDRSTAHPALYNVVFSFLNFSPCALTLRGIKAQRINFEKVDTEYDLTFTVDESQKMISAEFLKEIYDETSIKRFVNHYFQILAIIPEDLSKPINSIQTLTDTDKKALEVINRGSINPVKTTVKTLLERKLRENHSHGEVIYKEQRMSHEQLHFQADALSGFLLQHCQKDKPVVGLIIDRSLEMVIAVLAVIKTGGSYVPIDPTFPKDRIEYILNDSKPDVILTMSQFREIIESVKNSKTIFFIDSPSTWQKQPQTDPLPDYLPPSPEDVMYTIYTSGSTGKPKGVQVEHHSVANLLLSMKDILNISKEDSFLAVTTLSFDIACLEILMPLVAGCKLFIADQDTVRDGQAMAQAIQDLGITYMQATPTTWQLLVSTKFPGKKDLTILVGGEELTSNLAGELLNRSRALWNLYGPTETTIWSSVFKVTRPDEISIGHPISNTQFHFLNESLQDVPMHLPAELYIEGEGLARGYLDRPDLTAEKFIKRNSHRLYRTGDLVKYDENGMIHFLGRGDNQVKIRGHRIELDEISTQLLKHPSINQCIVQARSDGSDKRLVAYLIPEAGTKQDQECLKAYLKQTLPDYMIPAAFVFLEAFPLTPNAKIDRNALPDPIAHNLMGSDPVKSETFANSTEKLLAEIWSEVLGRRGFTSTDNFFALGGHSLLVVQLMNRINNVFEMELPIRIFFNHSNIQQLASVIEEEMLAQISTQMTEGLMTNEVNETVA